MLRSFWQNGRDGDHVSRDGEANRSSFRVNSDLIYSALQAEMS